MARFCALLGAAEPIQTLHALGATQVVQAGACALASLPDLRPWLSAGPYCYALPNGATLHAAGEVSLFNRSALLAHLPDLPQAATFSDGELLLALYAQHGTAGFAYVEGMFALAIWDGNALTLVRDPVGARTLFYTRAHGQWAAASTLIALRRWPAYTPRLNLSAVQSFLTFAYLPGAETLLTAIHELLPGQHVRLSAAGTHTSGFYWLPSETLTSAAPAQQIADLRTQLEQITAALLPSGQAVGVLLSGGIDSSLVTALAARLHDQPVQTYSINFGAELPNELAYSQLVATHCRTQHQVLTFSGQQVADHLASTVALLDCPVGDPLTVPNLLLARAAAAAGLRVILNGEGGDPCFGGPKNLPMIIHALQQGDLPSADRAEAYLHSYRKCYSDLPRLLSPALQEALRCAPPLRERVAAYLHAPQMTHYLNRLLLTNVRTKGAHHILTKVERLTAACGIEGRAPLFSRAIVAQSFRIAPELKLAGTVEKWALKQAVRDLLPAQIIDRPKSGMRVPVQHWLRGPLRDLAADTLLGTRARERGLFQPATIRTWLHGDGMAWPRQGIALWMLVTLELWLRTYLDDA
jgi:asparagine synthase (glutamine-hydrolysing)